MIAVKPNWDNETIWTGDCLDIMRGMNSDSIDLIYLDPPFNSNANYAARIGSEAAGAEFKDIWGLNDINLAWHGLIKHDHPALYALLDVTQKIHGTSMMSYLIYMAVRIMEMGRLLKRTGSIYLHCDPVASHYLKLIMDAIFGKKSFRNEIVWSYSTGGISKRHFARKHDTILYYGESLKNQIRIPSKDPSRFNLEDKDGRKFYIKSGAKYYLDRGVAVTDVWDIPPVRNVSKERTGYPTQKPLALLQRIITASSNEGEMVLDPFCGCATACIASGMLNRQWVGIDISPKTADLVRSRMHSELGLFYRGSHRSDVLKRTDLGNISEYNSVNNQKLLYDAQGGYCNGCGKHCEMQNLRINHIISIVRGGTNHISNLQLLCDSCDTIKGTKSQEELLARLIDKGWIKRTHCD